MRRIETGPDGRRYPLFSDRLRQIHKASGFSREDVYQRTGVNKSTFSKYMAGLQMPKGPDLQRLAEVYGVDVAYFTDPAYQDSLYDRAVEMLADWALAMMDGGDIRAEVDRLPVDAPLLDKPTRRRLDAAAQARLRDHIRQYAPGVWEQLDRARQRELVVALLRQDFPRPEGE